MPSLLAAPDYQRSLRRVFPMLREERCKLFLTSDDLNLALANIADLARACRAMRQDGVTGRIYELPLHQEAYDCLYTQSASLPGALDRPRSSNSEVRTLPVSVHYGRPGA